MSHLYDQRGDFIRDGTVYARKDVRHAWLGWCARASVAPQPAQEPAADPESQLRQALKQAQLAHAQGGKTWEENRELSQNASIAMHNLDIHLKKKGESK
jgi:hypothetical protein